MNILFLALYEISDTNVGYIYADLVREFSKHRHRIFAVTPTRSDRTISYEDSNGVTIIKVKNGQIQKTGKIKKVLNLLTLERKTIKAVKRFAKGVKFDLIINMCSNLCFAKTAAYFKKRDGAVNFLLMKDIFPQNAVDIGMMKTTGIMGFVFRHFRKKEKRMYKNADFIGCMSQANANYIAAHNPEINTSKLVIIPNSIEPQDVSLTDSEKAAMRAKYGIPQDKTVFVYGGNLGKPQDIPFIIECLLSQKDNEKAFFFIVGDGTEFGKLQAFVDTEKPQNVKLMRRLLREDFDSMLAACDVGLIFLDHRFTVPNYPSRLLSYMQAGVPVFACTDHNTDVGQDIVVGGFGWKCESSDVELFVKTMELIDQSDLVEMGENAKRTLQVEFAVSASYEIIISAVQT